MQWQREALTKEVRGRIPTSPGPTGHPPQRGGQLPHPLRGQLPHRGRRGDPPWSPILYPLSERPESSRSSAFLSKEFSAKKNFATPLRGGQKKLPLSIPGFCSAAQRSTPVPRPRARASPGNLPVQCPGERARRKPQLKSRRPGVPSPRPADRQRPAPLSQLPPRRTRYSPARGPSGSRSKPSP